MSDLTFPAGIHQFDSLIDINTLMSESGSLCHNAAGRNSFSSLSDLIQWLDNEKAANHILSHREGLKDLNDWTLDESGSFTHKQNKFFRVIGIHVETTCREVRSWEQPIINNPEPGIIGLLIRKSDNRTEFLMQAKSEVGNRHIVQIAPTVQFTPQNYLDNEILQKPFLFDEFIGPSKYRMISESRQSEEGGRFYKEYHTHRILLFPEGGDLVLPRQYRWLTIEQLRFFLHMGEYVNYCARSIIACALSV